MQWCSVCVASGQLVSVLRLWRGGSVAEKLLFRPK